MENIILSPYGAGKIEVPAPADEVGALVAILITILPWFNESWIFELTDCILSSSLSDLLDEPDLDDEDTTLRTPAFFPEAEAELERNDAESSEELDEELTSTFLPLKQKQV